MSRSSKRSRGTRNPSRRRRLRLLSDSHPFWRWAVIIATVVSGVIAVATWIAPLVDSDPPESVRTACLQLKDVRIASHGLRVAAAREQNGTEDPQWRQYIEEERELASLAARSGDDELSTIGNAMWNLLNSFQIDATPAKYFLPLLEEYSKYEERCAELGVPVYWSTGKIDPSIDRQDLKACRDVESVALLMRLSQTSDWRDKRAAIVQLLDVYLLSLSESASRAKSETIAASAAAYENAIIRDPARARQGLDDLIAACHQAGYEINAERQIP